MDENFLLDDMGSSTLDIESICFNCELEETILDFIYG